MKLYEESLKIWKKLAAHYPENPDYQRGLSVSYYNLSEVYYLMEDLDAAVRYSDTALSIAEGLCRQYPQQIQYLMDLSNMLRVRAILSLMEGNKSSAQVYLSRKEEVDKKIKELMKKP